MTVWNLQNVEHVWPVDGDSMLLREPRYPPIKLHGVIINKTIVQIFIAAKDSNFIARITMIKTARHSSLSWIRRFSSQLHTCYIITSIIIFIIIMFVKG